MFREGPSRDGITRHTLPRQAPSPQWLLNIHGTGIGSGEHWYGGHPATAAPDDLADPAPGDIFVAPKPVLCDDTLYVATHNGLLASLDPDSGEQRWSFAVAGEMDGTAVVTEDRLYMGATDRLVHALDHNTGEELWSSPVSDDTLASPSLVGGVVYTSDKSGQVVALDWETGERVWTAEFGSTMTSSSSWPEDRSQLVIGARSGSVYALDASDGTVDWEFLAGEEVLSTAAHHAGRWFIGSWDNRVYALDSDGTELWRFETGANVSASPLVVAGLVIIGSWDWTLYALDEESGALVWSRDLGSDLLSSPTSDGETVLQLTENGVLVALDVATGVVLWARETSGIRTLASAGVREGWIYTIAINGDLQAWTW